MKKICYLWRRFKYEIEKMRIKGALRRIEKRKKAVLKQLEQNGYSM